MSYPVWKKGYALGFGALALIVNLMAGVVMGTQAKAEPIKIMAFGDSLVHGYGLPQGEAFPDQLQVALTAAGHDVALINAGVSGDTTQGGVGRMDWALADDPDIVILELGANDALRGLEPSLVEANLDTMLARFTSENRTVVLAGMLAPPNLGAAYGQEFNSIYPRLAEKYGVLLYPFFLDGVAGEPQLNQPDGIHPNNDGVALIIERILPTIEQAINQHLAGGNS